MKAYQIEGVDTQAGTVVLEVDRVLLAPIANLLQAAQQTGSNNTHVAIRSLGGALRNAAKVLYGEADAEQFGFDILDPIEDEQEVHTGTGG